jgi:hypothetical protein
MHKKSEFLKKELAFLCMIVVNFSSLVHVWRLLYTLYENSILKLIFIGVILWCKLYIHWKRRCFCWAVLWLPVFSLTVMKKKLIYDVLWGCLFTDN